ncbi:OmpP1/FadL family transporter [Marimonas arenosa]|uniref:Outer membrane protein transport protein n=1 Tax=Marimonas arenosa TaxID=1795305 RepID=A0AAE3W9U6_9RHOB|nr:outer membrane protein transport protein [Marimonas arenosa]MDQ2088782.1 outer membrane protein transport protein [Marimonas arenosa]
MNTYQKPFLGASLAAGLALAAAPAMATTGYFSNGTSVQSKGMAGAGVSIGTGVMGAASNPAFGLKYPNQVDACLAAFMPSRSVTITGFGTFQSDNEFFPVPCIGGNFQLGNGSTLGVLVYGNGGMNTDYPINFFGGVGPLGVNLEQLFVQVNYATEVGNGVTLGFAPIVAAQRFSATGLQAFDAPGFTTAVGSVTDNGDDWSVGFGAQIGVLIEASPNLTFGASVRSKIKMDPFESYAGLFADAGDFDIPASATIGMTFMPPSNSALKITAEWQRIFYSGVGAIGNSSTTPLPLGSPGGPGFGWKDMDVFRLAAEYEVNSQWTVRGGVSYNTEFAAPIEATFNALAPATPQLHASIGGTYRINNRREIHMSYTHAFDNDLSGPFLFAPTTISEQMSQHEIAVGMTWKW